MQQIKDKLSIVDVVSQYVQLQPAGKNLKGKSPFTNEKTPSFYVSPDRGMYYCFSSSQGGDIFTFVQAMEGVDFKGALTLLAEQAGVELVAEDPAKKSARDRMYDTLEQATQFWQSALPTSTVANEYIQKRGLKPQTVGAWRVGYAPGPPADGWRDTKQHLLDQGFTETELNAVGLIKSSGAGKDSYDVFRYRLIFPISDAAGRVVGFSGRYLGDEKEVPKYVNSPETDLYQKSQVLYGYDKAKSGIRNYDFTLVVEGQFDVVMSHQAGYTNAVAVSGTALTLHHVDLMQRLSNRVVLALDGDRAGVAAVKRSAKLMLERGMDVKVASLPDGMDPADIILSDVAKFKRVVARAVHVIEFLLSELRTHHTDDRAYKLAVREEVLPFIIVIPNQIDQDHFVRLVAKRIEVSKDALLAEIERLRTIETATPTKDVSPPSETKPPAPTPTANREQQCRYMHAQLLAYHDLVAPELQGVLGTWLSEVTDQSMADTDQSLPENLKNETKFMIEEYVQRIPKIQLYTDIAHTMTRFAELYYRQQLQSLRESMLASDGDVSKTQRHISALHKKIGELQFSPEELITAKKTLD